MQSTLQCELGLFPPMPKTDVVQDPPPQPIEVSPPPITILPGDCIEKLRELQAESVQCCVTSPPYWGLRDYGVAGQLGLEKTPDEYVAKMVEVFREVRRVLREDGTLWLNLGDSYATGSGGANTESEKQKSNGGTCIAPRKPCRAGDLKPKDLVGIPWMVAFALRADGWYLRSDIIWHKPNPMPESVTDRPTKAHEYLFLLGKSARYYYDSVAIAETASQPIGQAAWTGQHKTVITGNHRGTLGTHQGPATRNKRTVWTVTPRPYRGAHFATYPPDLIKPCILAGTSARGCCPKCGKPWERVFEESGTRQKKDYNGKHLNADKASAGRNILASVRAAREAGGDHDNPFPAKRTIDWKPACRCFCIEDTPDPIPCTVLDPFGGSGTTGQVALELGRKAILVELNPEYIHLILTRCNII